MIDENDEQTRMTALDPFQSFIVQAPAGSGKTELLTQRYLSLLSQACNTPEEIIAITFTRKAALEMRERVLLSLQSAQEEQEPLSPHKRISWRLAREALQQDKKNHWNLLENPQRLRIMTIDALCAELSKRLPILSGHGALSRIVEDASSYYESAVRQWIIQESPAELLVHLDNDSQKLVELCIELLNKREQWLPYLRFNLTHEQLRNELEAGLAQMATEILESTLRNFSVADLQELSVLLRFAGENLQSVNKQHPLTLWAKRTQPLTSRAEELESWKSLAQALLTEKGEWRKKIDIQQGFPPKSPEKSVFQALLGRFSQKAILLQNLRQILECPMVKYQDSQWRMLTALIKTLPSLCAHLQVIFQQQRVIDFVELSLSAHRALGDEQEPTDLALALDYQIRHFLVDEFQDTSIAQFALLEKLLQGWEPGDGRSIFLVGDPMQSIYRFRNAEVGLFIRARQKGIQQFPIASLTLKQNFRSGENLIEWFNRVFAKVLSAETDETLGAVPYSLASASQPQTVFPAVQFSPFHHENDEAQFIIDHIQQIQRTQPSASIAILVRSRTHLTAITQALQNQQIKFQAVEIESLSHRSEIQDLFALTRALHHQGDRIAWLAILRAPYCGLKLEDLHQIAAAAQHITLYEVIKNFESLPELSEDAKLRLRRILPVLTQTLEERGRINLSEWIQTAWQELGGEATLETPQQWINTQAFFKLLRENQSELQIFSQEMLSQKLEKLRAATDPQAGPHLQIMTIHKAKGLEFDYIFLPQLHRRAAKEKHCLLLWTQITHAQGGSHLLLAPIKAAGHDHDSFYDFLRRLEQQKLTHESKRLLYVATTRAKQALYLTAILKDFHEQDHWKPHSGSFLEMLWPFLQAEIKEFTAKPTQESPHVSDDAKTRCQRLTIDWVPAMSAKIEPTESKIKLLERTSSVSDYSLEDANAIHTGIVVHEALADLAEKFPDFSATLSEEHFRRRLWQLGVSADHLEEALSQVRQAVHNITHDPRGLWILSTEHRERKNEYARTAVQNGEIIRVIVDRTFVDNNDVRWIIDYKTGEPSNVSYYYQQLALYAKIFSLEDSRTIKTALYFPLNSLFIDITDQSTIAIYK